MRKSTAALLVLVLCIGLMSGCGAKEPSTLHTFHDLTILLPLEFLDLSNAAFAKDYDFLFGYDPITVSGLRDEKTLFASYDLNTERYGMLVMEINGLDSKLTKTDGIWNTVYTSGDYTYVVTFHETKDAFWTVQSYCPTGNYSQASDLMWEILKSVTA